MGSTNSATSCHTKWHKTINFKRMFLIIANVSILAMLTTISSVDGSSNSNKKDKAVYSGNLPSDVTQRISILIGGEDVVGTSNDGRGLIGIMNDEDGGSRNSSDDSAIDSTTWSQCKRDGTRCCYQYTWPGHTNNIPTDPNNATCDYLRKQKKDDNFPCFDPLVYTYPGGTGGPKGTPPDFKQLKTLADRNNWNIYCLMADKSCVKLTYYTRTGNKTMTNQTNFCGEVMNTNSGSQIENGCFKENVAGFVREVCVCRTDRCNDNSKSNSLVPAAIVTLLSLAIFSYIL